MKKILVIEDEAGIRASLVELLEMEGFEVFAAEAGYIGVGLARKKLPDLILCDIMMPDLDGYGVLAEIRQMSEINIPFIFLTAKADMADLRQGMALGADDYITKPFTRVDLLNAINTRLARQDFLMQQSQKRLEKLSSQLTRALPHEFITPLSIILLFSEFIAEEQATLEPSQIVEMAGKIHNNAERLYRLIQKFLLHAELEVLALDPAKREALLNQAHSPTKEIITSVATERARQFGRPSDLELELQEALVLVEGTRLQKLFEELLDNAFRYSNAGSPVRVVSMPSENELIVYVIDNGRGMTTEQIANIGAYVQFERNFYEQQGTGLGLSIAKRLTELYGGKLSIESVPKVKTIIRLALPRVVLV